MEHALTFEAFINENDKILVKNKDTGAEYEVSKVNKDKHEVVDGKEEKEDDKSINPELLSKTYDEIMDKLPGNIKNTRNDGRNHMFVGPKDDLKKFFGEYLSGPVMRRWFKEDED